MNKDQKDQLKQILNINDDELQDFLEILDLGQLAGLTVNLENNKEEAIKNLYNLIGSMKENINFFESFINEEDDAIVEAAINLETFLNEGDKVNLKIFKSLNEVQIEKFTNYLPEIFKTLVLECVNLQEDRDLVLKCKIEEAMKNKWRKQSYAYKPHRDEPVGTKKLKFFDFDKYLDPEQNVKLDQYGTLEIKKNIVDNSKK